MSFYASGHETSLLVTPFLRLSNHCQKRLHPTSSDRGNNNATARRQPRLLPTAPPPARPAPSPSEPERSGVGRQQCGSLCGRLPWS